MFFNVECLFDRCFLTDKGQRSCLLDDLRYHASTHSLTTLTNGKTQTFGHGHRVDELHLDGGVVSGYNHLHLLGEHTISCHVGGAEEELGTVISNEEEEGGRVGEREG